MLLRYNQIRECDIANGEGIGAALFVQGCHFHCKNCFNTETWDFDGGKEWTPKIKEEFLKLIDKPYIKRISILGGEPLANENLDDVLNLVRMIYRLYPDKKLWIYTGYNIEDIFHSYRKHLDEDYVSWHKREKIISYCDVMVDGRYVDEERDITLKWRGSKNQRVIDIQKSFVKGEVVLWTS